MATSFDDEGTEDRRTDDVRMEKAPGAVLNQFIKHQMAEQERVDKALAVFAQNKSEIVAQIQGLLDTFNAATSRDEFDRIDVFVVSSDEPSVEVAFGIRAFGTTAWLKSSPQEVETELGARIAFSCDDNGMIRGLRWRFRREKELAVMPELIGGFGEPEILNININGICGAVVDFLQWAAVGDGCGSRKLRFK